MAQPNPTQEAYEVHAAGSLADVQTRVLKHGDTFAVFNRHGDVRVVGLGEQGIFHQGTRHLSRLSFSVAGREPVLLSSTVLEDNAFLAVDLTNPDLDGLNEGTVHVFRSAFLWEGACHLRLRITNYGPRPVELELTLAYDADFVDLFEVRGTRRLRRGRRLPTEVEGTQVVLGYEGLDGVVRRTRITSHPPPDTVAPEMLRLRLTLAPKACHLHTLRLAFEVDGTTAAPVSYEQAFESVQAFGRELQEQACEIETSNEQFNALINRSVADLRMMTTRTAQGLYPYAGVPWYSTAFGRDGLITGLQTLWMHPELSRGVLHYLAAHQAETADAASDAEPGKIMHETRQGEMATLGEIPFRRYYGSIDATPLFVMLAGRYYETTGDIETARALWPHVRRALDWIDRDGDSDGDGFVEYRRKTDRGLLQQGWKDSFDSVFHEDGSDAPAPIALCEVQGYVYAARRQAAVLARALGEPEFARAQEAQAETLKARFDEAFWLDDLDTYALALDGNKRPCRVRTSNAGHCLLTGIARPDRAERLARHLATEEMFSGWGLRTLGAQEARYNPMSYHNGSVWPHDTALVAQGLARYGHKELTGQMLAGLFGASLFVEQNRLPELFCGFRKRRGEGPTLYPVACSPQAWASGAPLLLLQSVLGLFIDAPAATLRLFHPVLPPFLEEVRLRGLPVGPYRLDLRVRRYAEDVAVALEGRTGPVEVVVVK